MKTMVKKTSSSTNTTFFSESKRTYKHISTLFTSLFETPISNCAYLKKTYALIFFVIICTSSYAQTTFTSVGAGSFTTVGASVWSPATIASDFTDGLNTFIIADGHIITLDGASTITVANIEVGQGSGTGTLTIGDGTTPAVNSITINNTLVIQTGSIFQVNNNDGNIHALRIDSDIVNNGGTFDLENGTGLVNTTLTNTATAVLSGTSMIFNDLTINGGGGLILIAPIDVNGNFSADLSGSDVVTTSNHSFAGNFTLTNDASFTATSSTQFFNGATPQSLSLTGGTSEFYNLTFDNSTKNVDGNIISNGTTEITSDAVLTDLAPGNNHQLGTLEVKNAAGITMNGSNITFTGGEIRFGDDTNTDGTITLGTAVDVVFDGNCYLERDDQLMIDGDVEITSNGFLVINGTDSSLPAGEIDSELTVTGSRTLTIRDNGDLYIRGYDNFPTSFNSYALEPLSLIRYDADYDQIVMSENSADATIPFGRLYLSQADASPQRTRQLFTGDDDLTVLGQFNLVNGVRFLATHVATITFGEDIQVEEGTTAGDPIFSAPNSIVILDANINQIVDGPVAGNYEVDEWQIINSATPTTIRQVNIRDNILIGTAFSTQNINGSPANNLIVDLNDNQIFGGVGTDESFSLGADCAIYSSTDNPNGFAEGFSDAGDVISIDATSVVRFDRAGNQSIPDFNGGAFGTIQFTGSGNKYITSSLDINGNVTRVGGTPVFRFGTRYFDPPGFEVPFPVTHTVNGNWNMGAAYTGEIETSALITFDGIDQNISASNLNNVTFDGSGTKTITGTLFIDGSVIIEDGVLVNGGTDAIDIAGDWTENGTGTYTQTGSTIDFNGGATSTIIQSTGSSFNNLVITNNTNVDISSTVQIGRNLNIETGSSIDIEGQNLRISRDLTVNTGAAITYSTPATTTIIFDGDTEQDLRNIEATQNFPTFEFEGVGNKEVVNNILTIEGDLTIASESTFNGNGFEINFEGDNWINNGNFNHNNDVNFLNAGGTTTVSTSTFHDIEIGLSDGSVTTSVVLNGNISLNGEMNIFANGSLDVSASNFSITVEEDWNNYGVFNAQQGTVTCTGGRTDFRTFSLADPNTGAQLDKAFYNLTINIPSEYFLIQRDGLVLNDQIDILNDLNVVAGSFYMYENDGGADPGPSLANIGGDLIVSSENGFIFSQAGAKIIMNGSSGTHSIDLGGDVVRDFEINATGATYQLINDFEMQDATAYEFTLTAGTLDLNGNSLRINRGGMDMTGGTLIIDESASLILNDGAANPDFNKTGGTLQLVGIDGSPATLTAVDDDGFTFTQTGGDFQAQYYTLANTSGEGLRIEGGTLDTGSTGNDFSNGTFTSGSGTAYLTLANIAIGTLSASNVVFNAGPTNNVAVDLGNLPVSGSVEFVIAGGSLAGAQDESDSPDGSATTGFIRWDEDPGLTWVGTTSSAWNVATNWSDPTDVDADNIPDADDIIYIEAGAPNDPIIGSGENYTVARATIRSAGVLTFEGNGELSIGENFTVFSGSTVNMTDNPNSRLNVAGAWSNAGTFNEGNATITFNGTSGTHSITTSGNADPFYNLIIDGAGATYTLGSIMTVSNSYSLTNGIFDASSGFNINMNNDWSVNGGIFEPGQGTIFFNGTSGTQSISGGTMYRAIFEDAALKSINGNISVANDFRIENTSGIVSGNDRTIFVGEDWDIRLAGGFDPGTGTVIFNGANQDLEDQSFDLEFNDVIFQNTGTKECYRNMTVNGNFYILSDNNYVDILPGTSVNITGSLSQTGGELRIFDSNFPTAGSYNLSGGEVEFRKDGAQTIPANITFNDVEIRDGGGGSTTATLTGNITLTDDLVLDDGAVTLDVAGFTISVADYFTVENDEVINWAGGTLIQTGAYWGIDADFNTTTRSFENLILEGTGIKRLHSDVAINGNLTITNGVEFEQLTWTVTNDGDDALTMEVNSILDNRVIGLSLPSGFASYDLHENSRVDLLATGNQTIFTNAGTLEYGMLRVLTVGTATLDGNLTVQGNFIMNNNSTLADGGFDMVLNGATCDIRDYPPTVATTISFNRNGDQTIVDNDGAGQNLEFENTSFGGTGTKTLTPNAGDEIIDIDGTVTIASGVTVTTNRIIDFSGSAFINSGTFNLNVNSRPLIFSGSDATFDPGTNTIAALTVSNTTGTTVTIQNNGLNLGNGDMIVNANAEIDFGSLTHTLASENILIDVAGSWILENGGIGAILDFNQNGGQNIPIIDEGNANITGIPSIISSTAGTKTLTGNIVINDLTIGANTNLDIDNMNNYQLTVNGNWENTGGDFYERDGTVIFNSDDTNPKTINPNGENFRALTFQGSLVRTYTLQNDAVITGNSAGAALTLTSATLDINGNTVTLGNNDTGDPDAELNIIGTNGTLQIDEGASLLFETSDDGGDVLDTEIGGNLDIQTGGRLSILGSASEAATISRSAGGNRVDINIETGGEIEAEFYSIQFLTDEGLEVEDGAIIDPDANGYNFSNGIWSNLATDAGILGVGGDDNPVIGNRYLTIESDDALTINNVVFNFSGTPNVGQHFNVTRSNAGGNNTIDFNSTSGPLGRNGSVYEDDGDATTPAASNGQLTWDLPIDSQWIGSVSVDWSDPANWDNGVPSIASNDVDALINIGDPFNPSIDNTSVNISALIINDGILKIINTSTLDLDGDVVLGDGSGGALIMDNSSLFSVEGSWTASVNVIFDNGDGTISFDAAGGNSVSISPGNQSFHNLTFTHPTAAGEFNLVTATLDVNGDLTIENGADIIPSTTGYNYSVAGNITATTGSLDTSIDGEFILDGADQTITDMSFDELTASGTGTKTTDGTLTINDNFEIEPSVIVSGGGSITFDGDVLIEGVLDGVTGQTYTFTGDDWIAAPSSYTGLGTVEFNRPNGTQYIRQTVDGDNPVEFNNLTLSGNAQIRLGRLIGGNQDDGNIDMTGNLTVNNTINTFRVDEYLVDNTSGTGIFNLADGEIIYVTGANNFPSNFATYDLHDNSTARYWGTIDQTVRGVNYGHVELNNNTVKTLDNNIDINGNLVFRNSTFDASTNNYSINLAGRWDTNNGNDDGSFIARSGTVIFDGSANQTLDIGETGAQTFNDVTINKSAGNVEVATSNIVIAGDINALNGTFDLNGLMASIAGNMNASGTGVYASNANGNYFLNASSGSPTISTNGSIIGGNIEIDALGRTYELIDDLTLLGSFTLSAGTLDINGQTMSSGDLEDVVDIFGTLNVSTTAKPGGTLALGNDVQLVVKPGGAINLVGTSSQLATITSTGSTDYLFSVTGTLGNEGSIAARNYLIKYVNIDGIYVNANTIIDATNNFSDGTFQDGFAGGKYLRIENEQDMTGANRIENIVFDDNPGGGATNIYKATAATGNIEVFNYTGGFSGEDFDEDPNDLVTWLTPPTVTWTGIVSNDWFTNGNWDSNSVPLISQNVSIPQTLNEPIITDNVAIAVANNLTIEVNSVVEINTTDGGSVDIQIAGDITFDANARFESFGSNDEIEIAGSWLRLSSALFTKGTSEVTFNSPSGFESIDNNDGFYNLIIDVVGTAGLSTDISVINDVDINTGTLSLLSSDLTIGNELTNNSIIDAQTQTVFLIPEDASSPKSFNPGTSELYSLVIGETLGNVVEYDLGNSLTANHNFNLVVGTLDQNSYTLNLGNTDGSQDDITISGTLLVEANETMALGGDAAVLVTNGGDLRFNGTDASNASTLTRRTSGAYSFNVQSGGTFEATNFVIEYMEDQGIWLQSGAILASLTDGIFRNGNSAVQYLRLSNAFPSDVTATNIDFNTGPTYNARRNEGAGNNIIFENATGVFSGSAFELDDGSDLTGEIRWDFVSLRVWNGNVSTQYDDDNNWEDQSGITPASFPTAANSVHIPDVSAGSNIYPIIDNTSGDQSANNITIFAGALLTINDNHIFTITDEFSNAGTLTITGTGSISVGDSWTNVGVFNPGNSSVTLTSDANVPLSGGVKFYNLEIDAAGTGAGIVFSSSSLLDVDNDFIITDGTYEITDPTHTLNIGGDFIVDDTNGSFIDNLSIVTLDGANQSIGSAVETATISFNDLILSGSGTKTLEDAIDINGDLTIEVTTAFALINESVTFSGNNFTIDGSVDVSGGTSTVTFDGAVVQSITSPSTLNLDNFTINNTAVGNSDVILSADLTINNGVDFVTGIIQSSASNTLTFLDGSTVSYDGTEETAPITLPGADVDGNSYTVGPVIKIGDDDFIFPIGEGSRIARIGISGIANSSATDQYSAEYFFSENANSAATKNGGIEWVSALEYWDLSNLNSHSGQPLVTLYWNALSEVTDPSMLTVAHYNGTSWDDELNGGTTGTAASGTITSSNNFTSFSPVALASSDASSNPLPVELLYFNGEVIKTGVELSWETASEINNDYFEVEKSANGVDYEIIATINGAGTVNTPSVYMHIDKEPYFGVSYYRLKQTDFDGKTEIFTPIEINNDLLQKGIEVSLFPNPTSHDNINVRISSGDQNTPIEIVIYDLYGKVAYKESFEPKIGVSDYILNTKTELTNGLYQIVTVQGLNLKIQKLIIN